jgi:uncharacterized protein
VHWLIEHRAFAFALCGSSARKVRRGAVEPGSEAFGKTFENWVFHELSACVSYRELDGEIACWRLASGIEVDFILGDMAVAVEAKPSARITADHLKGLRTLVDDHPGVQRRIVVCREPKARRTDDGIDILPYDAFVRRLWHGELI